MITKGSIYLISKDFDKSVHFYKLLLERDVTAQNMNRFAIFNIDGLCLSIMNGYFDSENPDKVTTRGKLYEEYDDCDAGNTASEKTILANGGVFEKTIDVDGCTMKRYWISL